MKRWLFTLLIGAVMTTYNTGNAVGSTDARDLSDNAQNLDYFSVGAEMEYPDRLGVFRKSLAGLRQQVADWLVGQGWEAVTVPYAAGAVVLRPTQLIERLGELYRVRLQSDMPLTLDGDWTVDAPKLVAVGNSPLRQELAGDDGVTLVGNAVDKRELEAAEGAGDVGYDPSLSYPPASVGYGLQNPAGFSYKRAPSPYQAESGLVIGDQRYSAATIGAGSILLGGWNTAVNQYNRLPGTRNLRMILGGYDNEITAGTSGDDGGLACIIVGSHHSKILDAATHATVVGGSNHQMRGDFSAFVGGTLSEGVVGADFALTTGLRAKNRWGGSHTMGMGFSAAGDMQTVRATLRATSTSATVVEMQTTSASTSRLSLVDNSAMVFDIMVVGRRTDSGTEAAAYHIRGAVKRGVGAASVALIGTPTITVLGEDDASWNVNVVASTSSGVLQVLVYGAAGKTIRWGGRIDMAEVAF